jgi:hypothetical protein
MYCRLRFSYQEKKVEIPLTSLTPPHCCACPNPRPRISTSNALIFFAFNELKKKEEIVRFY